MQEEGFLARVQRENKLPYLFMLIASLLVLVYLLGQPAEQQNGLYNIIAVAGIVISGYILFTVPKAKLIITDLWNTFDATLNDGMVQKTLNTSDATTLLWYHKQRGTCYSQVSGDFVLYELENLLAYPAYIIAKWHRNPDDILVHCIEPGKEYISRKTMIAELDRIARDIVGEEARRNVARDLGIRRGGKFLRYAIGRDRPRKKSDRYE